MSGTRLIRISSRALGEQARVHVLVYPTLEEMRAAGQRFTGNEHPDTTGMCQAYCDADQVITLPVIRLAQGHLGVNIVAHEVHHAATALYGASLHRSGELADLSNANESFAHLYSDLLTHLVDALYRRGLWS